MEHCAPLGAHRPSDIDEILKPRGILERDLRPLEDVGKPEGRPPVDNEAPRPLLVVPHDVHDRS